MKTAILIIMFLLLVPLVSADKIISISLAVNKNNTVEERNLSISNGRPTLFYNQHGIYPLVVQDKDGKTIWNQSLNIYFDYSGPVLEGVDYSNLSTDTYSLYVNIPYDTQMHTLQLQKENQILFSAQINFCNPDADSVCVIDCINGTDPDCKNQSTTTPTESCGDGICGNRENEIICPQDCKKAPEPITTPPEKKSSLQWILFTVFIVLIIIVLIVMYLRMRQPKAPEQGMQQ
jgi:hypothetical protein